MTVSREELFALKLKKYFLMHDRKLQNLNMKIMTNLFYGVNKNRL